MAPSIPPRVPGQGADDQGWLGEVMSRGLESPGGADGHSGEAAKTGSIEQVPRA